MAFSYIIWLFVFLFVSYALGRLYAPFRRSRFFKICFAPGFLALGGLKILACSVSGAEIRSVKFFARDREAVQYDLNEVSFLGKVILATFPLIGALLVFALIAWAFAYPVGYGSGFDYGPVPDTIARGISHFGRILLDSLTEMVQATGSILSEAGHGNVLPLVYLYVLISILLALPPTTRELKYAILGIVFISLVILIVTWAGVRFSGRAGQVRNALWVFFSFALALVLYVTAVTSAAISLSKLIQSITAKRNKPDETGP